MPEEDDINRMTERLDVESLRKAMRRPSRFGRIWDRLRSTLFTRTALTVLLAAAIVAVLAVWYLLTLA